ncbi:MAG: 50S ribosomal protein L21 [Legionella sp.]|nr:50S ribosomal protein L21 [Legionella sp.]
MYAVIKTGGKQYRVKEGDVLKIERLAEAVGDEVVFPEILMISNGDTFTYGTPCVENASVKAEVVEHARHKKVKIIKFRRRKHYMRRMGHRQNYTQIKITAITQ